jgi:hypothetical protein
VLKCVIIDTEIRSAEQTHGDCIEREFVFKAGAAAAARHKSRYIHFQRPHFGLHRRRRVITKQQAARENHKGEVLCAILSNLAAAESAAVLLSCLPAAESIELLNEPTRDVFARSVIDPHQQQKHAKHYNFCVSF